MIDTRGMKRVAAGAAGLVLAAGLAACGGRDPLAGSSPNPEPSSTPTLGVIPSVAPIPITSGIAPTPQTATITMLVNQPFEPAVLTVAPATVITVRNVGSEVCNLTDQAHGLNSGDIGPGASVHMIAPDTPGTYNYACIYYPDTMKGTLIVSRDVSTPRSAEPTPTATPTATPTDTTAPAFGTDTGTAGTPTGTASPTPSDTPTDRPLCPTRKHPRHHCEPGQVPPGQ